MSWKTTNTCSLSTGKLKDVGYRFCKREGHLARCDIQNPLKSSGGPIIVVPITLRQEVLAIHITPRAMVVSYSECLRNVSSSISVLKTVLIND
jgi:hypothetical protein